MSSPETVKTYISTMETPAGRIRKRVYARNLVEAEQKTKTFILSGGLGVNARIVQIRRIKNTVIALALLLPAFMSAQKAAVIDPDTTREYRISNDTLYLTETWPSGFDQYESHGATIRTPKYFRRRLIYLIRPIAVQRPAVKQVTETITRTIEVWQNTNSNE